MAKKETTTTGLGFFTSVTEYINKYGYFSTICNAIVALFVGIMIYFAINPDALFERYDKYTEKKHSASTEYRLENAPKIKFYLNQMAKELGAEKTFVMEYHNGKSNPSGLQWQYGDITFLNDDAEDITDEYQNVSLVKYSFANDLCDDGFYYGSIDELKKVDKRLALRLESSDVTTIGAIMLYGDNLSAIGFLGVSYKGGENMSEQDVQRILTKYSNTIAPLLDGSKASVKIKYNK